MNKTLRFKNWLHKRIFQFSTKYLIEKQEPVLVEDKEKSFHSLSPVSDIVQHKQYCDALNWALKNRVKEDIKNIALTGTYGSGKSSILKTLQDTNQDNSLKFLNISLASFKDEEGKTLDAYEKKEQLRLIELSILQQIFYHEDQNNIPDSRFKKVRSFTNQNLKKASLIVLLFLGCVVYTFYLLEIQKSIGIYYLESYNWVNIIFKVLSLLLIIFLSYFLIRRFIQFFQKFTVHKLNFNSLEIEVSEKVDKSILNHHIDEILYFFEASDYSVVIIEDLDRFKQTEIFTKLREVNLLINNSKPINKHVVFIYAVRDEMFQGSERTKFFDFIVPVIPVINYSNSKEKLLSALKSHDYEVHIPLINEIAFFIDDMRLLYNIANEFAIYKKKLQSSKHNQQKLLSLIVYKNLHPSDFVDLLNHDGFLYKILHKSRAEWITPKANVLNLEIDLLQNKLNKLKDIQITSEVELREKYVLQLLLSSPDNRNKHFFQIDNKNYKPKDLIENTELFESFIKSTLLGYDNGYGQFSFDISFSKLEQKINPGYTYSEYVTHIREINSGRISGLKDEINSIKEAINKVRRLPIKELIVDQEISEGNPKQSNLIYSLISSGFIAEDYLDYISYFYEGDLTRADFAFLMDNRNELHNAFDFELVNVESVFDMLNTSHFDKIGTLNFQLVDLIVSKVIIDEKAAKILKQFDNENHVYGDFLFGYIERGLNVSQFVSRVFSNCGDFWSNLLSNEAVESERLTELVKIIISCVAISAIKAFVGVADFLSIINKNPSMLNSLSTERLQEVLTNLEIRIESITNGQFDDEKLALIEGLEGYKLNVDNVQSVLQNNDAYDESIFKSSNYTAIIESRIDSLKDYVADNITEYVSNVFCEIEENTKESIGSIMLLLNNEDLDENGKENVLTKSDNKITKAQDFKFYETMRIFLLTNTGLQPNWNNVIFDYGINENSISDKLVIFLNNHDNAALLSQDSKGTSGAKNIDFRRYFILCNKISTSLYRNYLAAFPEIWKDLDITMLSVQKIEMLISEKRYSFSEANYSRLENKYPDLLPLYIDFNLSGFLEFIENHKVNELILLDILKSVILNNEKKVSIVGTYTSNYSSDSQMLLLKIADIYMESGILILDNDTKLELLEVEKLKRNHRIRLVNNLDESLITTEYLNATLVKLGGDYKKLTTPGLMPSFIASDEHKLFFELLQRKGMIKRIIPKGDMIKITTYK